MRLFSFLLASGLIFNCLPVSADLIPPEVAAAEQRLRANPAAFDRIDNFCTGKKPGEACTIPGSTFAGGGDGVCKNRVSRGRSTIDLSCERNGSVEIDRQIPEGDHVFDISHCRNSAAASGLADRESNPKADCVPKKATPSDRFCKDREIGSSCTVELYYQDRKERHDGVCKLTAETKSYYSQGPRTSTRAIILCQSPPGAERSYVPATWWQKLSQ